MKNKAGTSLFVSAGTFLAGLGTGQLLHGHWYGYLLVAAGLVVLAGCLTTLWMRKVNR